SARRRTREMQAPRMTGPAAREEEAWHDLQPIIDRELEHLPAKYRAPVVICDLEGRSRKTAARNLGLAEGTLSSRLARGRGLLARRLRRCGLALPAGLAASLLSHQAAAAVPAPLAARTIEAAANAAAGKAVAGLVSAPVAALTEGVI